MLVDDLIATGGTAEGGGEAAAPDRRRRAGRLLRHRPAGARRRRQAAQARRAGAHADLHSKGINRAGSAVPVRAPRPCGWHRLAALPRTSVPPVGRWPAAPRLGAFCVLGLRPPALASPASIASGPGSWPPANFTSASTRLSTDGWVSKMLEKPSRGLSMHISITAELARGEFAAAFDLAQRRDHGVRILGQFDRAGVGEIFALARQREADDDRQDPGHRDQRDAR